MAIATMDGGLLWAGLGLPLYRYVTGATLAEADIKNFMEVCPPFRAACYGLAMAWFNGALKLRQSGEPQSPGRNDLLMAAYLPYCSRFVTGDWVQEKDLSQVAAQARIDSAVMGYEEFSQSFTAGVTAISLSL